MAFLFSRRLVINTVNDVEKEYRDLLIQDLDVRNDEGKRYTFLLGCLWKKEFYSIIDHDNNRGSDGLLLREQYGFGINDFGPARCLEVLLVLAKSCSDGFVGSKVPRSYQLVFWDFLRNLDLDRYDNGKDGWSGPHVYFEIDEKLSSWLERRYSKDGNGGIFPLKDSNKNQKKVELWYQMQNYIIEQIIFKNDPKVSQNDPK